MGIFEMIFGLLFAGIIIAVFVLLVKKENEECNKLVSMLTEEQKNILKTSEAFSVEGKKYAYTCTAIVAKMVDKGNKMEVNMLYVDKFRMGATYNKIVGASSKITKEEQGKYNLKVGDYVKLYIDFDKFEAKIMFD